MYHGISGMNIENATTDYSKNRIIAWQPKPQPYKSESEDKE